MAEEPMLGLFDGDTNFLDELAGPSAADIGGPGMVGGSNGPPGVPGMNPSMQQGGQMSQGMMMGDQQMAPPNNMGGSYHMGMGQESGGYPGMQTAAGSQANMMGHQQYGNYQYGPSMAKMGHNQGMMMQTGSAMVQQQQQQRMQPQPQQQAQQPFSPPVGSGMMQQHSGYGMHPQQQQGMAQMGPMMSPNSGWNQNQTSPTQVSHPHGQYMSPGGSQVPYNSQAYQHQQMNQYSSPAANKLSAPTNSPYIRSPNPMPTSMTSPPSVPHMVNPMQQIRTSGYPSSSQHNPMMQGSYNASMDPQNNHYHSEMMLQQGASNPPMSIANMNQHWHYSPYSGTQQGQHQQMSDPRHPSPHYSAQQQSQSSNDHAPYPSMPQQRPSSTSVASPLPTQPSPQSMSTNQGAGATQGSYGQSSLQQLEQLVSPGHSNNAMSGANPYQQLMQQQQQASVASPTGCSTMMAQPSPKQQAPIYSSTNFPTTTVPSTVSGNHSLVNSSQSQMGQQMPNQNMMGSTGFPVQGTPPAVITVNSPLSQTMLPGMNTQASLEAQLQQLMTMPQNQQVSQQMLDIQERLRILRSQHQIQIQQQQQKQQQQHQMQTQQQQQQQVQQPGPMPMPNVQQVKMLMVKARMQLHQQQQQQQQQMIPPQNQMGHVSTLGPVPPSPHMQPMMMNNQPIPPQQANYALRPQTAKMAPTAPMVQHNMQPNNNNQQMPVPHGMAGPQSIPSPQKVQPFQSPMDSMGLVFPSLPAVLFAMAFYLLCISIFPVVMVQVVFAGIVFSYLLYDMTHYYILHGEPYFKYFQRLKSYYTTSLRDSRAR